MTSTQRLSCLSFAFQLNSEVLRCFSMPCASGYKLRRDYQAPPGPLIPNSWGSGQEEGREPLAFLHGFSTSEELSQTPGQQQAASQVRQGCYLLLTVASLGNACLLSTLHIAPMSGHHPSDYSRVRSKRYAEGAEYRSLRLLPHPGLRTAPAAPGPAPRRIEEQTPVYMMPGKLQKTNQGSCLSFRRGSWENPGNSV